MYQILSKSVAPLRRYCDFSIFQDGHGCHLGFLKSRNFIGYCGPEVETHQRAKFRQNWSIGCEYIKIFRFFTMAAVAILDFRNHEFLFADGIYIVLFLVCALISLSFFFFTLYLYIFCTIS